MSGSDINSRPTNAETGPSDGEVRPGQRPRLRAIRKRRRKKRQSADQEAIQRLSNLSDEQLEQIAGQPTHDVYHNEARRVSNQRRAAHRKEMLARISKLPIAGLAELRDADLRPIKCGSVLARLRPLDEESLANLIRDSQSESIREWAAQVLAERRLVQHREELRRMRETLSAVPTGELERLVASEGDQGKIASELLRERRHEEFNWTAPLCRCFGL